MHHAREGTVNAKCRLQMKSFQTRSGETVFDTETALSSLRRPSGRVLTRKVERGTSRLEDAMIGHYRPLGMGCEGEF